MKLCVFFFVRICMVNRQPGFTSKNEKKRVVKNIDMDYIWTRRSNDLPQEGAKFE